MEKNPNIQPLFQMVDGNKLLTAWPLSFNLVLCGCHKGHNISFDYLALFRKNSGMIPKHYRTVGPM